MPTEDSDSDSEFWGDLAARTAAQRRAADGLPRPDAFLSLGTPASDGCGEGIKGINAGSLAFSAAMAAAQHPVFDLGDPEVWPWDWCSSPFFSSVVCRWKQDARFHLAHEMPVDSCE